MVHFADLIADLEADAPHRAFLDIDVAEEKWPSSRRRPFNTMKRDADPQPGALGLIFEGGAGRFFNKGTNGRWRDVLTESDLALYEAAAAELAPELRAGSKPARQLTRRHAHAPPNTPGQSAKRRPVMRSYAVT